MLKKFLVICLSALPCLAAAQTIKLGHIDSQVILYSLPETSAMDSTLKNLSNSYASEISSMQDEGKKKMNEYQQGSAKWDDVTRQAKEEELRTLDTRIRNYQQNAEDNLQKKQQELSTPIREKVRQAIQQVGKEQGVAYIFDLANSTIVYKADNSLDLTNVVLKKLGCTAKPLPTQGTSTGR